MSTKQSTDEPKKTQARKKKSPEEIKAEQAAREQKKKDDAAAKAKAVTDAQAEGAETAAAAKEHMQNVPQDSGRDKFFDDHLKSAISGRDSAFLGYCIINLFEDKVYTFEWGTRENDRPKVESAVNQLAKSMAVRTDRINSATVIHIPVKGTYVETLRTELAKTREWNIDNITTVDPTGSDFPKLTDILRSYVDPPPAKQAANSAEAEDDEERRGGPSRMAAAAAPKRKPPIALRPLGGQHRAAAVRLVYDKFLAEEARDELPYFALLQKRRELEEKVCKEATEYPNREDEDLPSFGELRATEVEYNAYTTRTQKRNQFVKLADTWLAAFYAEDAMPPDAMLLMSRNMQHYHLRETKEEVLAEIIRLVRRAENAVKFPPRKAPYIPDIDFTPPDGMVGETQIALAKRKAINAARRKAKNAWLESDERKKLVKGYCDLLEQLTKISCLHLWPTPPEELMTRAQLEELIETEGNQAEKDKAKAKKGAKGKGKPGAKKDAGKKDASKKDGGGAAERDGEQGPSERMYYIPNTVESAMTNILAQPFVLDMLKCLLDCGPYFRQDQEIFTIKAITGTLLTHTSGGIICRLVSDLCEIFQMVTTPSRDDMHVKIREKDLEAFFMERLDEEEKAGKKAKAKAKTKTKTERTNGGDDDDVEMKGRAAADEEDEDEEQDDDREENDDDDEYQEERSDSSESGSEVRQEGEDDEAMDEEQQGGENNGDEDTPMDPQARERYWLWACGDTQLAPDYDAVTFTWINAVDAEFENAFLNYVGSNPANNPHIEYALGQAHVSPLDAAAFSRAKRAYVTNVLERTRGIMELAASDTSKPENLRRLWREFPAKVAVYLCVDDPLRPDRVWFPILTRSVYHHIVERLTKCQNALYEISLWVDPTIPWFCAPRKSLGEASETSAALFAFGNPHLYGTALSSWAFYPDLIRDFSWKIFNSLNDVVIPMQIALAGGGDHTMPESMYVSQHVQLFLSGRYFDSFETTEQEALDKLPEKTIPAFFAPVAESSKKGRAQKGEVLKGVVDIAPFRSYLPNIKAAIKIDRKDVINAIKDELKTALAICTALSTTQPQVVEMIKGHFVPMFAYTHLNFRAAGSKGFAPMLMGCLGVLAMEATRISVARVDFFKKCEAPREMRRRLTAIIQPRMPTTQSTVQIGDAGVLETAPSNDFLWADRTYLPDKLWKVADATSVLDIPIARNVVLNLRTSDRAAVQMAELIRIKDAIVKAPSSAAWGAAAKQVDLKTVSADIVAPLTLLLRSLAMNNDRNNTRDRNIKNYKIPVDAGVFKTIPLGRVVVKDANTTGCLPAHELVRAYYTNSDAIEYERKRTALLVEEEHFKTIVDMEELLVAQNLVPKSKLPTYERVPPSSTPRRELKRVRHELETLEKSQGVATSSTGATTANPGDVTAADAEEAEDSPAEPTSYQEDQADPKWAPPRSNKGKQRGKPSLSRELSPEPPEMTQTTFGGDDAQLSDEGPARPGVRAPFTQKPSRAALSTQDLEAEDADGPGLSPPQEAGFSFAPSDAEHEEDSADDDMPVEKKGIEAKVEVEIEKEGSNNGMDVEEDQSILPSHEEVEDEGAGAGVPDSSDMLGKEAQESGVGVPLPPRTPMRHPSKRTKPHHTSPPAKDSPPKNPASKRARADSTGNVVPQPSIAQLLQPTAATPLVDSVRDHSDTVAMNDPIDEHDIHGPLSDLDPIEDDKLVAGHPSSSSRSFRTTSHSASAARSSSSRSRSTKASTVSESAPRIRPRLIKRRANNPAAALDEIQDI